MKNKAPRINFTIFAPYTSLREKMEYKISSEQLLSPGKQLLKNSVIICTKKSIIHNPGSGNL